MRPRKALLGVAAGLIVLVGGAAVAEAYTVHYYKNTSRQCNGCIAIGELHRNRSNWMYVSDCGGWNDNNCSQEVWEQDRSGPRHYTVYHAGRGWVGRDHAARGGLPACQSHTDFAQNALTSCYQGYGRS